MKSVKILHLADYHIGYEYAFLKEYAEKRRLEVLDSLRMLSKYSNMMEIDLVLIAGDFLEASTISAPYVKEVKDILSTFFAKIFIVAGNHDYISVGSYYLDQDWPENVYIFKTNKFEKLYIKELEVCIYGASFTSSYQREGLLSRHFDLDTDKINICLVHGDALFSGEDLYNPISREDLLRLEFDYLALGHIHKKSGILQAGDLYYAYPGSPVGLGFAELGPREAILGNISKDLKTFSYKQVEAGIFLEELVDVSEVQSERALANQILANLSQKYDNYKDNYYRFRLTGFVEEDFALDLGLVLNALKDLKYAEIIDDSKLKLDLNLLKDENSLRGVFIKNILQRQEEAKLAGDLDKYLSLEHSLNYTLKAFEGRNL